MRAPNRPLLAITRFQHPQASKLAHSHTLQVYPTTSWWVLVSATDIEPTGLDFRIRAPNRLLLALTGF